MRGTAQAAGHSNKIQCVKFKTANMLATGSMDGTVKIWSTGGPEPILSLPMAAPMIGGGRPTMVLGRL